MLIQRFKQSRECLNGDDDDTGTFSQGFRQLFRFTLAADVTGDGAHHPLGVLKLVDGVL